MTQAKLPLALIPVAVGPLVLAVAVGFVLDPLADVAVPSDALPHTVSMLDPIDPLTIVRVPGHPRVEALPADRALVVLAQVLVPIAEAFVAFAVALVIEPLTFIDSSDFIDADALAVAISIDELAAIKRLLVTLDSKVLFLLKLFKVEEIRDHLVDHKLHLLLHRQMLVRVASFPLLFGESLRFRLGLRRIRLHVIGAHLFKVFFIEHFSIGLVDVC